MFHISKNGIYYKFGGTSGFCFDMCPPEIFNPIASGLILFYDTSISASYGGSGATITDLQGNSNGTLVNSPTYSNDNDGILIFNGTNEGLYTNTTLNTKFSGTSPTKSDIQSLFIWVNPISQGNIVVERGNSGLDDVSWFNSDIDVVNVGGNAEFRFSAWAGNLLSRVTSSQTFNQWYYSGWTYDGTTLTGYINGVSVGSVALNRIAPYNVGQNLFFSIGSSTATNMGVNSYANMKLGAFQVYNTCLNASQILQNYNSTKERFENNLATPSLFLDVGNSSSYPGSGSVITDIEANANATLYNAPNYFSSEGGFLRFNGTDEYGTIPDISGITDFTAANDYTIEVWCRIDSTQNDTGTGDNDILEKWNDNNEAAYPYVVRWIRGSNSVLFGVYNGAINPAVSFSTAEDVWVQLVGVFDHTNNSLKGYKNGSLQATSVMNIGGTINNSSTVNIARRAKTGGILGQNYFTGDISVVKIYNKALSTNEIVASFNSIKDRYGI